MLVVDASLVIELLLGNLVGDRLREELLNPEISLHAPELLYLEVAQVLHRYQFRKELKPNRVNEAWEDLQMLPLERYSSSALLSRIWQLRNNISAYNANYIALSEALAYPLLTLDKKLSRSVGHGAEIRVYH